MSLEDQAQFLQKLIAQHHHMPAKGLITHHLLPAKGLIAHHPAAKISEIPASKLLEPIDTSHSSQGKTLYWKYKAVRGW